MSASVAVEIFGHVAEVRLNRPEKRNALNLAMMDALAESADRLAQDKTIRAVVLSGEGEAFCAGLDLECFELSDEFMAPFREGSAAYPNRYQRPAMNWKKMPVPVICALHGVAFGGGLQVALGADIRIAHPQCRLSLMEIKWGLIPDMGGSQTLRQLVRQDVAKELVFSGRILSADAALPLGLVTSLSAAPRDEALALAGEIAKRNPDAMIASKYLFDVGWQVDENRGLAMEEALQGEIIGSNNQIEAVSSQIQGRAAQYQERRYQGFGDLEKLVQAKANRQSQ